MTYYYKNENHLQKRERRDGLAHSVKMPYSHSLAYFLHRNPFTCSNNIIITSGTS